MPHLTTMSPATIASRNTPNPYAPYRAMTRRIFRFLLVLGFVMTSATFAQAELTAQIVGDQIRMSGLKAGGSAAVFGISRFSDGYDAEVVRHEFIAVDEDADGNASIKATRPFPLRTIVVVVDLQSGAYASVLPERYRHARAWQFNYSRLKVNKDGLLDALVENLETAELLLVRPSVGAWRLSAADGGEADADKKSDRQLRLALASFVSLRMSPPGTRDKLPKDFKKNDVIVLIEPNLMGYYVGQLEK